MIYNASLWLHIIGFTLLAGTTVIDFILTRKFWTLYDNDPASGKPLRTMMNRLPLLTVIGTLLILLSGAGMMVFLHAVFGAMLWFRIKMALVLLVILNGAIVGRKQFGQLNKLIMTSAGTVATAHALLRVRRNLNVFHLTQLGLLLTIFFLSAFKFN